MSRLKAALPVFLGAGSISLSAGVWVGIAYGSFWAFLSGLLLGLFIFCAFAPVYSLLAWFFGWPKLPGSSPGDILNLFDLFVALLP